MATGRRAVTTSSYFPKRHWPPVSLRLKTSLRTGDKGDTNGRSLVKCHLVGVKTGVDVSIPKSTGNFSHGIRDCCLLDDTRGVFQPHKDEVVMPIPVSFLSSPLRKYWS